MPWYGTEKTSEATMNKTRMKLGDFEFEAEGDKASVDDQLSRFEALIEKVIAGGAVSAKPVPPIIPAATVKPPIEKDAPPQLEGLTGRIFKIDGNILSLRVLPKTKAYAADSLLVLLQGYHEIIGKQEVLAGDLLKAGKQSGLQLDRVDRVLEPHSALYDAGGARKGRRYRLNNTGIVKAKEIMDLMSK
jgi:hypothetical protein